MLSLDPARGPSRPPLTPAVSFFSNFLQLSGMPECQAISESCLKIFRSKIYGTVASSLSWLKHKLSQCKNQPTLSCFDGFGLICRSYYTIISIQGAVQILSHTFLGVLFTPAPLVVINFRLQQGYFNICVVPICSTIIAKNLDLHPSVSILRFTGLRLAVLLVIVSTIVLFTTFYYHYTTTTPPAMVSIVSAPW